MLDAIGQERDKRATDDVLEEPKNDESERQAENQGTEECVSEAIPRREKKEIFKVWSQGARDDRRHDEACALKWKSRYSVGRSEGHISIMRQVVFQSRPAFV